RASSSRFRSQCRCLSQVAMPTARMVCETSDAAGARNSLCVVEGREAAATGAEGAFGFAQQAGVEQRLKSQPAQQQLVLAPRAFAFVPIDTARTPCRPRTNTSMIRPRAALSKTNP